MPTPRQFAGILSLTLLAVAACGSAATAITVTIDYTTDTKGFFGSGNRQGAAAGVQAKAALDAAAQFYSGVLEDTFSAIEVPDGKFFGSLGGEATWFWKRRFLNPETGFNNAALNVEVAANEYVVFAGARDLPGDQLGNAGSGGMVEGFLTRSGTFTNAEDAELDQMEVAFRNATKRGQATGIGRWGGSAAFDNLTTWHFNHTTNPLAGETDFYSVALHELGHALGLGGSKEWNALVSDNNFTGANVKTIFGNSTGAPLATDDAAHWLLGIAASPVYEEAGTQTPVMVPGLTPTTMRRQLTNLDAAALADIGWEIDLPGGASAATSLVSNDSSSASEQFAAFTLSAVPEPASAVLCAIAAAFLSCFNSRSRRFR